MRSITKGAEPPSLTRHRCSAHTDYDNYPDKDALRQSLVHEQRGVCCYCLSRIRSAAGAMKIEHWHSQNDFTDEQLDYPNLLGACLGGEGQPKELQHCDTKKGNRLLSKNPANATHVVENFVRYQGDGRIVSDDAAFNSELEGVLNLNVAILKNNRKAVLDGFHRALLTKQGQWPRTTLEKWLREWNGESDTNELRPFCNVVVYWLRKRLART